MNTYGVMEVLLHRSDQILGHSYLLNSIYFITTVQFNEIFGIGNNVCETKVYMYSIHTEKLHNMHPSPNTVWMSKSMSMRWK
jgi:hypothetical protein